MHKTIYVLIAVLLVAYGCSKHNDASPSPAASFSAASGTSYSGYARRGDDKYSMPIPVDTANRMIESYLTSINYPYNDSGLRSLSFNADTLRAYLSNYDIKNVKFMLAHQPDYINSGHFGMNAGINPAALTVVIVGTDVNGYFIRNGAGEVYEHCSPCPVICDNVYEDPYIH